MKRTAGVKYSWIVLGLFFVGLLTTALALFGITYLGSLSVAELEIERQVQKEDALARLAFETHLRQLENQLRTASTNQNLIEAVDAYDSAAATRILESLSQNVSGPLPDILILDQEEQLAWLNASLGLVDVGAVLPGKTLKNLPDSTWEIYSNHATDPDTVVAVIALPVIDPKDERVIARLVGGTTLNDSFMLLDSLARLLGVESIAIVHEGENTAAIGNFVSASHFARIQELLSETSHAVQDGNLFSKSEIYRDQHNHPIYVYTDETSDIHGKIRNSYLEMFVPFLLYVSVAALIAAFLLNRFTEPALAALVKYATARRNKGNLDDYRPGRIAEYNQLGSLFEEAFESVHRTNAQFRDLIDGSLQGVVVHAEQKILYVNRVMFEMLGYDADRPELLIGQPIWSIYSPTEQDRLRNYHRLRTQGEVVPTVYEVQGQTEGGDQIWLEQHVRMTTWDGRAAFYVTILDVTERKEQEKLIEHRSNYDLLTKLPNRNLFLDRLKQAITQTEKTEGMAALMVVDMDRFKTINDTFGHGFGDRIIKTVGDRIEAIVKWNETVARLGGDEFAIILPDAEDEWEIEHRAQTVLEEISQKIESDHGKDLFLTASIGITVYPFDGKDQDALLRQADAAMYQAKSDGGNKFRFFSRHMNERAVRILQLETALRDAIENETLEIFIQPVIDYVSGTIYGCEALARWHDAELGDVPPAEFIPIAEESGLIIPLGKLVLRKACEFHADCLARGLDVKSISVNISPRQCREDGFINSIQAILEETGMDPKNLRLEMTESVMFEDERINPVALLNAIKSLGVKISLDDFGTGYSSLSYLKRLPIDILKIDRSFIMDLEKDPDDQALVEAIISMAGKLGVRVICEGAETRQQCDILAKLGCRLIQGFYLARPMPEHEFLEFVADKPYEENLARQAG
ncbi:EAL domain-containing protein [Roseibium sp. MMSF_3544]|uniref:EAL domain-containing protein n=1 Tax=unclassified Roseibium TaxID=2629323 RepID=UPI00273E73FB|nr:EAL domain-containing protein [Roseibium sp. MMSF_3544]